jgi:SAM-dependent methyltransferase
VVTFGSSLNVLDRRAALGEARRLLAPDGWFAALWNHRDLMDPLQRTIDQVIRAHVPGYDPGSRRSDHRDVIRASGVFDEALMIEVRVVHTVDRRLWARAWRSHATLAGQAGDRFEAVVADIEDVLRNEPDRITVPYHTRVFVAQARGDHG